MEPKYLWAQRKCITTHLALCGFINSSTTIWGYFFSVPIGLSDTPQMLYQSKNFVATFYCHREESSILPSYQLVSALMNQFHVFLMDSGVGCGVSGESQGSGWGPIHQMIDLEKHNPSVMRLCWSSFQDPDFPFFPNAFLKDFILKKSLEWQRAK